MFFRSNFNPLPRKEGDTCYKYLDSLVSYFNPLPRKEGDIEFKIGNNDSFYFNPLPRKEGDDGDTSAIPTPEISIHSLVKRETTAFRILFPAQ